MKKKIISLLLAGLFVLSNITVTYATEGEIADMQAQKQQAEAGLAQAQADISAMEGKKQELEDYLSDLNVQYEELTNVISDLSAGMVRGIPMKACVEKAVEFLGGAIHDAVEEGTDRNDGVCFEKYLGILTQI